MIKTFSVMAILCFASPAFAQTESVTTTNDVVNAMMSDWAEYDLACRGTNPSDGSEGFCGARDYIGWALNQSGVCIAQDENTGVYWEACKADSMEFEDPLADVRADF